MKPIRPHVVPGAPPIVTELLHRLQQQAKEDFCPPDYSPEGERLAYACMDIIDIEHQLALDRIAAAAERKLL